MDNNSCNNNKIKILSLDVSSTCTGYSKFEVGSVKGNTKGNTKGSIKLLDVNSIKSKQKSLYERIKNLDDTMKTLNLYEWPDVVVFENYAFKGSRVTQLAELNGILKYQYYLYGKTLEIMAPATVKKQITGKGNAKKEEVRQKVLELPILKGITFKNYDESDAFSVGYSYIKINELDKEIDDE